MIAASRYTPSLLPGEDLEDLFVERHGLLDDIMGCVHRASTTEDRTHTLLVGPRGAGKTHLMSLVAHRTRLAIDGGLRAQLVWLPEDLWTVDSYESLAGLIAQELRAESPIPDMHLDKAIAFLVAQRGTAIVIAENLDEVLHSIGEIGQQQLRRLLSSRDVLLVATTTRLGRAFSDQARPFYGFFTTTKLEPFDVDAAARMLTKLAERDDDAELVAYLATPTARARLTVVEHLAGGAPRMWATLASALTVDALDQLVELLVTRFDDLTPYYQERLGKLSPQQRKIVARLAELDRAVSVKDLAADMKLPERSIGKAVNELHGAGWLQPIDSPFAAMVDKRRTYYELAEPMARLAFQLKASRGRPIRLVVEFLKSWFERSDLEMVSNAVSAIREYAIEALKSFDADSVGATALLLSDLPAPSVDVLEELRAVDESLAAVEHGSSAEFLSLSSSIRRALEERIRGEAISTVRIAVHSIAAGRTWGATADACLSYWVDAARSLPDEGGSQLVTWLGRAGRFDEAELAVERLVQIDPTSEGWAPFARGHLMTELLLAKRCSDARRHALELVRTFANTAGAGPDSMVAVAYESVVLSFALDGELRQAIDAGDQYLAALRVRLGAAHRLTERFDQWIAQLRDLSRLQGDD